SPGACFNCAVAASVGGVGATGASRAQVAATRHTARIRGARISALGELGFTVSSFVVGANTWDGQAGPPCSVCLSRQRRGPPPSLQKKTGRVGGGTSIPSKVGPLEIGRAHV